MAIMNAAAGTCDLCSRGREDHVLVTILNKGSALDYVVPSFPIFCATLREIKYQFVDTNDNTIFDGYIRECLDLIRPYPALVVLCSGYSNAFTIDPEEFDRSLPTDNKKTERGTSICHI